jgi:hypothetical protein
MLQAVRALTLRDAQLPRIESKLRIGFLSALLLSALAIADSSPPGPAIAPADPAPVLPDSAALRATVFGPRPEDMARPPQIVPLVEIDVAIPWTRPVPAVFWFDRKLRVWLSAQHEPAPLAIVIAGTGGDGNTSKLATLRNALFGAGYHVLTMPSPTFPGFIVSTSRTGVAGDLVQDSRDLYAAMQVIIAHLPRRVRISDVDILGYSLGADNAAVIKSLDATEGKLRIHRAVMINPAVSPFASIGRLDKLFALSIGSGNAGLENLYRRLYAQLANLYRASDRVEIDEDFLLGAAAAAMKTDVEFAAAISLSFRIALVNVFFAGDLYAGTGVVVDPNHPPRVSDSLEETARILREKPFSEYFSRVLAPYYSKRGPNSTSQALLAANRLDIIGDALRDNSDYYAQTNRDDFILSKRELAWLEQMLGPRIVVYDHGGHVGNLGERRQISDMLDMLAGRWPGTAQ